MKFITQFLRKFLISVLNKLLEVKYEDQEINDVGNILKTKVFNHIPCTLSVRDILRTESDTFSRISYEIEFTNDEKITLIFEIKLINNGVKRDISMYIFFGGTTIINYYELYDIIKNSTEFLKNEQELIRLKFKIPLVRQGICDL